VEASSIEMMMFLSCMSSTKEDAISLFPKMQNLSSYSDFAIFVFRSLPAGKYFLELITGTVPTPSWYSETDEKLIVL
jgi:hypothetical protein